MMPIPPVARPVTASDVYDARAYLIMGYGLRITAEALGLRMADLDLALWRALGRQDLPENFTVGP